MTNNAIQTKDEDSWCKHEEMNQVSFDEFKAYLNQEFKELKVDFEKDLLERMKDIAIDCYKSSKDSMNPSDRKNCFELFGFDYLIDEDFRVWLIEVNTNPGTNLSGNPNHRRILETML